MKRAVVLSDIGVGCCARRSGYLDRERCWWATRVVAGGDSRLVVLVGFIRLTRHEWQRGYRHRVPIFNLPQIQTTRQLRKQGSADTLRCFSRAQYRPTTPNNSETQRLLLTPSPVPGHQASSGSMLSYE